MTDHVKDFTSDLLAVIARIEPQIRGLIDLMNNPNVIASDAMAAMQEQLNIRQRRLAFIKAVLTAIDELLDDGYPILDPMKIPQTVLDIIAQRIADVVKAAEVFTVETPATLLEINLGPAAAKVP